MRMKFEVSRGKIYVNTREPGGFKLGRFACRPPSPQHSRSCWVVPTYLRQISISVAPLDFPRTDLFATYNFLTSQESSDTPGRHLKSIRKCFRYSAIVSVLLWHGIRHVCFVKTVGNSFIPRFASLLLCFFLFLFLSHFCYSLNSLVIFNLTNFFRCSFKVEFPTF